VPDTISLVEQAWTPSEGALLESAASGRGLDGLESLEAQIATWTGQHDAVVVASFEDALTALLMATDIGPGHEVLTGALGDARLAAAVHRVGAKLVPVDVDPIHLGPTEAALNAAITPHTRAVMTGPLDGAIGMLEPAAAVCVRHEVALIEVVGPWLGLHANGRPVGARGRASVIDLGSMVPHGAQRGGAVATSDDTLATACRRLRSDNDGPSPSHMPSLLCTLADHRLSRLSQIADACNEAADTYVRSLAGVGALTLPTLPRGGNTWWSRFVVRLDDALSQRERDDILEGLKRHDIECAMATTLHSGAGETCPTAAVLAPRLLALPLHARLSCSDAALVSQTLELMLQRATFSH
jgi:dTDP-4-amino-4,6-dideoxygalactose transaminase